MRRWITTLLMTLAACAGPAAPAETPARGKALAKLPGEPSLPPLAAAKIGYYKQAFPGGARWVPRAIPSHLLRSADVGNDTYVEAYALDGTRLGYLRDFVGPVSTSADCPCDPLNVTLVFGPKGDFETLLTPAPLTKYGHAAYSPEEVQRLLALLKDPPQALMAARNPDDVVDATSGATKPEYAEVVVPKAALETRRLAGLVVDTRGILKEAPLSWDKQRLAPALEQKDAAARAHALAEVLPTLGTDDAVAGAYRLMGESYIDALVRGGPADPAVEARLLDAELVQRARPEEQLALCYELADKALRLDVVERCARELARFGEDNPAVARLRGALAFARGQWQQALAAYDRAMLRLTAEHDPTTYGRYAMALAKLGKHEDACERALELYRHHPLLPQVVELANGCPKVRPRFAAELEEIDRGRRGSVLADERRDGKKVPPLELDDAAMQPVSLQPFEKGKATVLVFFATWCPHCQVELPKLNDFVGRIQAGPLAGKVNVVAVRTAIERETEPYEAFAARFAPKYPVFTDPAMSIALNRVARLLGIQAGLPTLLVLDETGTVRFVMDHGAYRDTARELTWAVGEVLGAQ